MPAAIIACRTCRSRLKQSAEMRMAAFCGEHCWRKFYSAHCQVCDKAVKPDRRVIFTKAKIVNVCSRNCRISYNRNSSIYAGFQRTGAPKQGNAPREALRPSESAHSIRVSEAQFSREHIVSWSAAGRRVLSLVPHPKHRRMWMVGGTMFTELEIEALLDPPPPAPYEPMPAKSEAWRRPGNGDIRDIKGPAAGQEIEMPDMPQFLKR